MKFLFGAAAAAIMLSSAAAAAQAPAPAQRFNWVEVVRHGSGPVFIDPSTVSREGNFVTVMSRSDFDEVQEDGTKSFVVRYRYDCVNRTSDLVYLEARDGNGAIMVSGDIEAADREVEPVPANSPNAAILARVCR
jgi:opacity protein-like surface antigen